VKRPAARSHGAYLLARLGLTQGEISTRTGLHQVQISNYVTGHLRPKKANREILCRAYKIPVSSWDEPVPASALPVPEASSALPVNGSASSYAETLQTQVRRICQFVQDDPNATPAERMDLLEQATRITVQIGKITGESQDIGHSRLIRLPAYRRMKEKMLQALEPWPDAVAAIERVFLGDE